jgi:CRISPR-associated endonuclease/helicase Cas3
MSFYFYWGKAKPQTNDSKVYHLLPYHCLDVAAVGYVLLTKKNAYTKTLTQLLDIKEKLLIQWFTFLLALHDLGKFTESFQNLKPELFSKLQQRTSSMAYLERHDTLGWSVWEKYVKHLLKQKNLITAPNSRLGSNELPIDVWMAAMVGHHGQPSKPNLLHAQHYYLNESQDLEAVKTFVEELISLYFPQPTQFPTIDKNHLKQASWWLSGLAVLSDWLGSNTDYFPYQTQSIPLDQYWQQALKNAEKALQSTDLLNSSAANDLGLAKILQSTTQKVEATPLQALTQNWQMEQSPHLFILEDVTGAGKTEAAILLAHALMQAGQANSFYFALPTMATANSMYMRMKNVYRQLFSPESNPSLVLAHGASDMVKDFRESVLPTMPSLESDYGDDTAPAGAYCNAWLADNRKKALLADVGIGTIDQALLAILPSRHQSLRLLGLINKVLIVDEIHAADSYQQELLQTLLKAHASVGGSAILLSATLPQQQRQTLVTAFAEGCSWLEPTLQKTDLFSYPLLTALSQKGLQELKVATRDTVRREVATVFIAEFSAIEQVLSQAIAQEQCACWIRNTVKDAVEAFQQLSLLHPDWEIDLFHARFALGDRLVIEKRVVERFDKTSSNASRKKKILIATQVVEQSLDLDFDFLISDLAPIDLLIQRAGRLRRHQRDIQGNRINEADQRGQAVLYIYAPHLSVTPTHNWYASFFPNAQKVYAHHGQLWLTAQLLAQKGNFKMPEDARALI